MAEINGKPFMAYVIDHLFAFGINEIILCVGHLHPKVSEFFDNYRSSEINIKYSIENEPLGTGGAVNLAVHNYNIKENFLLLNGDSIFLFPINELIKKHFKEKSQLSLSLKLMEKPYRYGTVVLNENSRVIKFNEKQGIEKGLINCGVYCVEPNLFESFSIYSKFSFEKDVMENCVTEKRIFGEVFDGYFIDIGLPESYQEAKNNLQSELSKYL